MAGFDLCCLRTTGFRQSRKLHLEPQRFGPRIACRRFEETGDSAAGFRGSSGRCIHANKSGPFAVAQHVECGFFIAPLIAIFAQVRRKVASQFLRPGIFDTFIRFPTVSQQFVRSPTW